MKIDKIDSRIAALYLGQKCENSAGSVYIASNTDIYSLCSDAEPWRKLVLHLRRIESLTEDEARDVFATVNNCDFITGYWEFDYYSETSYSRAKEWFDDFGQRVLIGSPAVWLKLLEWGIDLFGLIDAGLAKEIKPT